MFISNKRMLLPPLDLVPVTRVAIELVAKKDIFINSKTTNIAYYKKIWILGTHAHQDRL